MSIFLLALIAGLMGALFGATVGILISFVIAATSSVQLLPISTLFVFAGFVIGFQHTFQLALNHLIERFIVLEPQDELIIPPRTLIPEAHNPLLNRIDGLQPSRTIRPLSHAELDAFESTPEFKNTPTNQHYKKQLDEYREYMRTTCGITMEQLSDLKNPITIEGVSKTQTGVEKAWSRTYERTALRHWIETQGSHAREPEIRCDLSDPQSKINFHLGFASWVYDFIQFVRSILKSTTELKPEITTQAPAINPSRLITANQRNALAAGYPKLFSTPAYHGDENNSEAKNHPLDRAIIQT